MKILVDTCIWSQVLRKKTSDLSLTKQLEDIILKTDHFIKAAEFSNLCRKSGIQGSTTGFLICAVANLEKLSIFTIDNDFIKYNKYLKIKLIK